jgi:hypothetical protein
MPYSVPIGRCDVARLQRRDGSRKQTLYNSDAHAARKRFPSGPLPDSSDGLGTGQLADPENSETPLTSPEILLCASAFHHFPPSEARSIIQNSVDAKQGIGIFEITRRTLPAIASMILSSLSPLFCTPFVDRSAGRVCCSRISSPSTPFVLLFDGVVSCLRTCRPSELSNLVAELSATNYQWRAGEFRESLLKAPITCFIGFPRAPPGANAAFD